jgi:hypothetical protein
MFHTSILCDFPYPSSLDVHVLQTNPTHTTAAAMCTLRDWLCRISVNIHSTETCFMDLNGIWILCYVLISYVLNRLSENR